MTDAITNSRIRGSIVILRILIGWHFLYEGAIKLFNPDWSAFGYLATSQGPFKFAFTALAQSGLVDWVNILNITALLVVGITLLLGIFEKKGLIVAMLLLAMYYLAHPPFPWLQQINVEGNYWFVNKNLIELVVCVLLYQYPTGSIFGLGYLWNKDKKLAKIKRV